MSKTEVIEEFKNYQLCRQIETDEYLRVFRTVYLIKSPTGQKIGNIYSSLETAKQVFEQIKKDL